MANRLSDDVQVTIRAMREGGYTTKEIATALGLSMSTVSKYCININAERRAHGIERSRRKFAAIAGAHESNNPVG